MADRFLPADGLWQAYYPVLSRVMVGVYGELPGYYMLELSGTIFRSSTPRCRIVSQSVMR
jgi:hypothetical protein